MALRFETFYRIKTRTNLGDVTVWNGRFQDLDRRLHGLETALESVDAVGQRIEGVALDRINNLVTPLVLETINRVGQITNLFTASSASSVKLGDGLVVFVVAEGQRTTFAHQGYVSAVPTGAATSGLLGAVQSFDRASGELVVAVQASWGTAGETFAAWSLAAAQPYGAHANRTDNPHSVTAHQAGAYTTAEVDGIAARTARGATDNAVALAIALG